MRLLPASLALLVGSTASAFIDFESHSSYATSVARLELGDQEADLPWIEDHRDLSGANPLVRSLDSVAVLPNGSASSSVSTSISATMESEAYTLRFQSESRSTLDWKLDEEADFSASQTALDDYSVRLYFSTRVRIDISADLTYADGDSPLEPNLDRNRLAIGYGGSDGSTTLIEVANVNTSIDASFILTPDRHGLEVVGIDFSTYSSLFYSGYGSGEFADMQFGAIDATITITAIPAPSAALLLPLAAFTTRRRR